MLYKLAKNSNFIQNFVVNLMTSIHPSIMHNLGKIEIIKKAIWNCELESIEGGYFEFGIYEGTSLYTALKTHMKISSKFNRSFYGFDSFDDGFKYFDNKDKHPFFKEGDFVSSYKKVQKRFARYNNVRLIKGYFEETISEGRGQGIYGSDKCAIIFIDCDLMNPALVSLRYVKSILQKGSIIILDDYFAYKGDEKLGTCGAFHVFLKENPRIKTREFSDYGYGGKSFIVTEI